MFRVGSAMVDAATQHSPPRWEPRAAFGVGGQVLARAAAFAKSEPSPSPLAGAIALKRFAIAIATAEQEQALEQLRLATEHLGADHREAVEGTAKTLGERLREMERKASGGGREGGAGKRKATKKTNKAA